MTQSEEISHDVRRFAAERGVFSGSDPFSRLVNAATAAPATTPNFIARLVALLYGIVSYVIFAVTFLYEIGFVSGLVVPKTIDTGKALPVAEASIVNLLLMSLFAIQHGVMAREQFKQWWTRFMPKSVERSSYVLVARLVLILVQLGAYVCKDSHRCSATPLSGRFHLRFQCRGQRKIYEIRSERHPAAGFGHTEDFAWHAVGIALFDDGHRHHDIEGGVGERQSLRVAFAEFNRGLQALL